MACSSLTPFTMSIQPTYHGAPAWVAKKLGFFEEICLDATLPVYRSGAPQVMEISTWSIGSAGSPPNIQGWNKGVLVTAGINNDESVANALVANADGIASWDSIVAAGTLGDTKITVPPTSTAELVVEACLKKYNISFDPLNNFDYNSTNIGVLASLSDPDGSNFGGLWAPAMYSAIETWGEESVICNGADAGAHVMGGIMVSNEADVETAALGIAAYLKGITYFKSNPEQSKAYVNEYYEEQGFPPLSPAAMELEFTRPLYNLVEQQEMLAKNAAGVSTLGSWFQETVDFMFGEGVIPSQLNAEDYIDDKFMKWIAANETLAKWTMTLEETAPVSPGVSPPVPMPTPDVGTPESPTPDTPPAMEAPSSGNYRSLAVPIGVAIAVINYMFI
ncbi:hypothetical protein ACHAWT_005297 [Skeletonema menzelii]